MEVNDRPSFAFIANLNSIYADAIELAPGHILRRASDEEIADIKDVVQRFGYYFSLAPGALWEGDGFHRLPQTEWRYFVIEFRGNNQALEELKSSFELSPVELEVGFEMMRDVDGMPARALGLHSAILFHLLDSVHFRRETFFVDVSQGSIEFTRKVFDRIHGLPGSDAGKALLNQLRQLKTLPHYSPLRFLGYFALLESMLTHAPHPEDRYDSITRQVKKKLALLDHRWPLKIDYSPFGGAAPERVWTSMYAYRSALAHGGKPDFGNALKLLQNHATAAHLLKETTKAVLRQCLEEPQLMADLREC